MDVYFTKYLSTYGVLMIIIGIIIITIGRKIAMSMNKPWLKIILSTGIGLTVMITGMSYFLDQYSSVYAWAYILIAILLFSYHNRVTDIVT